MQHEVHVCSNGFTAVVAPQKAFPLVSMQVWIQTGSMHEGEHLGAGLSHLLEHMVFKGTSEFSARQLNERVPELGGMWNAYTSTDRTVFYIDGPAAHWREFLHLLAQLTLHPAFPREEWERERDVIRREMGMYNDDPQDTAYHTLIRTLYKVAPRRQPVIGTRDAFDALSYEDMVNYHHARYVPGNMFLCVAGDVEASELFAAVNEEFGAAAATPPKPVVPVAEPRQWGPRTHRCEFAQPTSTLMLAWRIPNSNHADSAAISLLGSILGDGRSAWLYKRFHDDLALAHDVSIMPVPDRTGEGALVLEFDVDRDKRNTLRNAVLEFMATLPQADFDEARCRSRRMMLTGRLRGLSTVQGVANVLGMSWHLSRNPNSMEEWDAALSQVTNEDIARVAATYFTPDRLVEVSVDPTGSNAAEEADTASADNNAPETHTLPNGLRIVTRVDKRVPMVYAEIVFGAGSQTETAANAGINSLLAECLLKGTTTRSAAQLANEVENLGGAISSAAGNNTFNLTIRGLAEDMPTLLELLADAALHPTLPAEVVETEKNAMVADIMDAEEDPAALAFRRLRRLCFGNVSYGNHRDGTVESVQSLTRDALVAQHARLVCAQNAVLAVAGDIDPAAVVSAAEKLFAGLPAGLPAERTATPTQMPADAVETLDKEQAVIALAVPASNALSDTAPAQLLFEEWCRDMAGPLFDEIREKRGLAYYAAAASLLGVDAGCLYFYLGTAPEQAAEARAVLEQTLNRLAQEGMPADALERARSTALTARVLALQSCGKRCSGMAVNTLLGLGADYDDRVPDMLRAVTAESMNHFLATVLSPAATRTWITVQPE
ncbi:MAG: insulinase family protein [Akkermansia sp.]|nr:insulinase family protein [Akkermansia sp.]